MKGRAARRWSRRIGTGAECVSDATGIFDGPQRWRRSRSAWQTAAGDTLEPAWRGGRRGGWVVWQTVRRRGCRQEGSGRARSLARALLNWFCQGQPWGRCRVRRRAERVSRPAREKKRRLRVLVVAGCSPRPMRAVQRARLWAITWTAIRAALAGKRPEGR